MKEIRQGNKVRAFCGSQRLNISTVVSSSEINWPRKSLSGFGCSRISTLYSIWQEDMHTSFPGGHLVKGPVSISLWERCVTFIEIHRIHEILNLWNILSPPLIERCAWLHLLEDLSGFIRTTSQRVTFRLLPVNQVQPYLCVQHPLCIYRDRNTNGYEAGTERLTVETSDTSILWKWKMSMMCGCLLMYDLFISFLWLNMPKAFFALAISRHERMSVSQSARTKQTVPYYLPLWGR